MKYQTWYIHQDGRQYGPITERELLYLARISKLDPDAHVWSVGLPRWRRAGDLEGLYRPPPLDGPEAALDPGEGPEPLPGPVVREPPVAAIPAPADESGRRQPDPSGRKTAGETGEPPGVSREAGPRARRTGAVAAQTLPAPDAEAQDHANDNIVKREAEIARLLFERVAKLEKAIEKEAHDRRRLKSAIEALVDYLAAESEGGTQALPRLPDARRALAAPGGEDIELAAAASDESDEEEDLPLAEDDVAPAPKAPEEPGYVALHWFGEHSLARSFWVNSLGPALVLTLLVAVVAASARHSALWSDLALAAVLIGSAPPVLWMTVGLLRSARRAQLIAGRRIAPALTRAWVLILLVAWLGAPAVIRFYPSLVPAPVLSIIDVTGDEPAARKGDKQPGGTIRPEPSATEPAPAPGPDEPPPRRSTA